MQSLIPSLQELSWRKLVLLFETLSMRVGDDGLHYISPRVVGWLEKIPDYVRAGLYERCLTAKLALPTLMHFLAVSPQFAPTAIDLRRSQRFNLGQLFTFVLKASSAIENELRDSSSGASTIKMEATPPAARRAFAQPGYPVQSASSGTLNRPQSPGPAVAASSPAVMRKVLLQRVKSALTSLRSIDVSANVWFNDIVLMQATSLCPNLESLNISYCKKLNASSISSALTSCAGTLTQLDLSWSGVTDNSIRVLTSLTNLQFLALSYCKNCSGSGISILIESPSLGQLLSLDLKGCNLVGAKLKSGSIRHLNVSHSDFSDETADNLLIPHLTELNLSYCAHIRDDALSRLVNRSPELRVLDVQFCFHLSTLAFCAPELRVLLINDCKRLLDSALRTICSACSMLSEIQARATQITDDTLRIICQYERIQVLNLSRCQFVTDAGLRMLMQSCPYLRDLDVSFNASLGSAETVQLLEAFCHRLKVLKIFGCTEISPVSVHTLRTKNPDLDVSCATSSLDWAMFTAIS